LGVPAFLTGEERTNTMMAGGQQGVNLIGDALRDALVPRLRGAAKE
jgi:hypothetical protein